MRRMMCVSVVVSVVGLVMAACLPAADVPGHVVINEIMWDEGEYIELYNPTPEEIDLGGWGLNIYKEGKSFSSESINLKTDGTAIIPPFGYFLIIDTSYFVVSGAFDVQEGFTLNNDGGKVVLSNGYPDYEIIDTAGTGGSWPAGENTSSGRSMERKDIRIPGNDPAAWGPCYWGCKKKGRNGTPGERNSMVPVIRLAGVVADAHATTLGAGDTLLLMDVEEENDFVDYEGIGPDAVQPDVSFLGDVQKSVCYVLDLPYADADELVCSPDLFETKSLWNACNCFVEPFFVTAQAPDGWFGFTYLEVTADKDSGSEGGGKALDYLGPHCPWDVLIESLAKMQAPDGSDSSSSGASKPGAGREQVDMWQDEFDEYQRRLYFIEERLDPVMRRLADAARGDFLFLLVRYSWLRDSMLEVMPEVLELIEDRDVPVHRDLREEIVRVSYYVDWAVHRAEFDAPELCRLTDYIRGVARDERARTVNEMLRTYGSGR